MGTTRDKSGRFAKQPEHKFKVGDLVDCTGNIDDQKVGCVAGKIEEVDEQSMLGMPYLVKGKWGNKLDSKWIYAHQVRRHVTEPKVEPVKAPAESTMSHNPKYYVATPPVDALEAAKQDGHKAWHKGFNIFELVEIGFRAGQKAATSPDPIAILKSKSRAIMDAANLAVHEIRAKAVGRCETINEAIAILKGGE